MHALGRGRRGVTPILLLAITLLGGWLRFYAIGQKGLWLDEAFSVWLGWHHLPEMWVRIAQIDQHPPLYYALLNLWMRLGDDARTVRLLSAVISTLTIPIIFLLGRRLSGPMVGLLAALLLAVSPFHVRFAQEARMYALLAFTAASAIACLAYLLSETPAALGPRLPWPGWRHATLRAGQPVAPLSTSRRLKAPVQDSGRRWTESWPNGPAWFGYVIFTAAAMLTHSAALLLPLAMNLFVFGLVWRRGRAFPAPQSWEGTGVDQAKHAQSWRKGRVSEVEPPPLRSWLLAQAAVLLLWGVIWLSAFIGQAGGVYREFWMPAPTWRTVVDALGNFLSAHLPRQQMPWLDAIWVVFAALLALGVATLRRRPAVLGLLLTLFLTPLIGELLISLRRPVFYDQTLIWATIPLYVLLATGVTALRRRPYILAAAAILVAANGVSLREYYVHYQKQGWREAAAYVSQQARPGDLILFNASWTQIPFDFYYKEAGMPLPEHGLPADLFDRGILEPKMASEDLPRLRELIRDRQRVWLVYSHNWYTDPHGLIPEALSRELAPAEKRYFEGLELQLYEGEHGN
jgi:mannosyltransferase